MPSQLFRITRAPEADPIDPRQVRRMISVERVDSGWDVTEMELIPARIVSQTVAAALRRPNATGERAMRTVDGIVGQEVE